MRGAGDGPEIRANLTIGLVADCYRPTTSGVVTSLVELGQELKRRGHHVVVITVDTPPRRVPEPYVYRFPSLPFNVASGFRLGLARPGSVRRILREEGVNLVHTHTEFSLGWAARCAGRAMGLPLVHTGHTLYEHYRHYLSFGGILPRRLIQGYLRAFLRGYDALVCPSRKARDYFEPLVPHLRTVVVGNGISKTSFPTGKPPGPDRARVRQALGISHGARVILYVGRMGPEKRAWQLLNALLPLLQAQEQVRALFVGPGPQYQAMVELAARRGVDGRILFPGAVPWGRMREFYLAADLFTSASLSEVHPMTLLEANACGLPAVVRRDAAYEDLVAHGYNGYLADSDEQLVAILSRLLPDAGELQRLSQNASHLAEHFTAEAHAARLEALYCQLLYTSPAGTQPRARSTARCHPA
jgi:1,2-diacylglycerol 3-alpha-glucosyltransferase